MIDETKADLVKPAKTIINGLNWIS